MTPTTTTDGMKVIGNKEIITKKKDGKTKPGMNQAGLIYLLEKKKAMVLLKDLFKMRRASTTARARTKAKEAWDLDVRFEVAQHSLLSHG